ncbi:MAG: hypothetical protein K5876_01420 [Ruminiclostridium sp.]|nr:hypothetical protein [Ruminiclostridium sp.]
MKDTAKKLLVSAVMCAISLTAASCSEQPKPAAATSAAQSETTTTAAAVTEPAKTGTVTEPEKTTASAVTSASPETVTETTTTTQAEEPAAGTEDKLHPFRLGVWLSTNEEYDGMYYDENYYCFRDNGGGSVRSQSMGIGVGFGYEMNADDPLRGVFHLGAADADSEMEIIDVGTDTVRVKWLDSGVEELWTYMGSEDDFSWYDSYSLGEMAKYLYGMSQYCPSNMGADPYIDEWNGPVKILIFDIDDTDGMRSREALYTIDRYTGKGTVYTYKENGVAVEKGQTYDVDLTMFEGEWVDMPYPNRFSAVPDMPERHELLENGDMLGFWYIGYVDSWMTDIDSARDVYNIVFEKTGMMSKMRLLKTFPYDRFVNNGSGTQLYYILPADEHGTITVTALTPDNDDNLRESDVLYSGEYFSYPLLLKCNTTEIYSDVVIRVTDSSGRTVEWSPFVSGENGRVVTDNAVGGTVRDFTDYDHLMHPDMMPGVG